MCRAVKDQNCKVCFNSPGQQWWSSVWKGIVEKEWALTQKGMFCVIPYIRWSRKGKKGRNIDQWLLAVGNGEKHWLQKEEFEGVKELFHLIGAVVTLLNAFVKTQNYMPKKVNFTVCKFELIELKWRWRDMVCHLIMVMWG